MRQRMDAVDDRQDDALRRCNASLLSGHQDLTPNSDATRPRLDPQRCVTQAIINQRFNVKLKWRQPVARAHGTVLALL